MDQPTIANSSDCMTERSEKFTRSMNQLSLGNHSETRALDSRQISNPKRPTYASRPFRSMPHNFNDDPNLKNLKIVVIER